MRLARATRAAVRSAAMDPDAVRRRAAGVVAAGCGWISVTARASTRKAPARSGNIRSRRCSSRNVTAPCSTATTCPVNRDAPCCTRSPCSAGTSAGRCVRRERRAASTSSEYELAIAPTLPHRMASAGHPRRAATLADPEAEPAHATWPAASSVPWVARQRDGRTLGSGLRWGTVSTNNETNEYRQHRFSAPAGATDMLLIRHGESAPARLDAPAPAVDGQADPDLDVRGLEEAQRVAGRLESEEVSAIYVTNLRRTAQTAAPLA